ncbi:hypothetical protein CW713_10255 [Methanophagales archaeon]|nr:MAG: hypothetical protein CW713_10255 [Methanophagales archaeon]
MYILSWIVCSESALQVQDADAQVLETSKSSAGVAPEDDRAGHLKILKGNEKRVIEALVEYGEMNQADLSARTWNTEVHAFENIARPGGPQFGISI